MAISQGNVMVYIEADGEKPVKASLEALTPARTLADSKGLSVIALVIGGQPGLMDFVAPFADHILSVENQESEGYHPDIYTGKISEMVKKYAPCALLFGGTQQGRELAARCAHRAGSGIVSDVISLSFAEDSNIVWTNTLYGGTILQDVTYQDEKMQVLVLRSGAFKKPEDSAGPAAGAAPEQITVEQAPLSPDSVRQKIVETVQEISEAVNLEDAQVIVSGGRGIGNSENFALVEELASVLGGVTGATRPAIEAGWISRAHQVGQSGKIVSPRLYIACGISGATQHVSGMSGSGYIVAINKDEDAPIFDIADIGIIGSVTDVLPVMIEEIKKLRQ